MKNLTIIIVLLLAGLNGFGQSNQDTLTFHHNNGKLKGEVILINNKLDGVFSSYYENGSLKAKGNFKDNQRIGIWEVLDTNGQKRVVREYINNRNYKTIEKYNTDGTSVSKLSNAELINNDSTYTLAEKDVLFSRSLFLNISEMDSLIIQELIKCGQYKGYKQVELWDKVDTLLNHQNLVEKLIKVKVMAKVEWIYDLNREMAFTRIFALGIFDSSLSKDEALYWIWYPDFRNWIKSLNDVDLIERLDIIHEMRFDFRCSKIKSIVEEDEILVDDIMIQKELLFDLFDMEHVLWFDIKGHYKYGNKRFVKLYIGH